jgi:hypothetical protein
MQIWCLGSSILKHAFVVARSRPDGVNLGVEFTEIWWQGYGGMTLRDVTKKLRTLQAVGVDPQVIILHCGGNDFGRIPVKELRAFIDNILQYINTNFKARVIWSEILPRRTWRYSSNNAAMESVRKRFNSYAATKVIKQNGFYIKHPDLQETSDAFYLPDGVHLTFLGNCIFLNQISSALQAFQSGKGGCFQ